MYVSSDHIHRGTWVVTRIYNTDISLGKYIRVRRLTSAVYQLSGSDTPNFGIASDSYFGSQSHFTYMLRKRSNITPLEFHQNPDAKLEVAATLHVIHQSIALTVC